MLGSAGPLSPPVADAPFSVCFRPLSLGHRWCRSGWTCHRQLLDGNFCVCAYSGCGCTFDCCGATGTVAHTAQTAGPLAKADHSEASTLLELHLR